MKAELPTLGAVSLDASSTRFAVWAPLHKRVSIHFPASDRVEPMTAGEGGYHTLITRAPPGALYRFEFADGRRRPDPASRAQPEGVHGPSMVTEREAASPAEAFVCQPLSRHVLYEMHVGTFTPEGTFDAVIPRLPALRDLGITAIELMPIAQFPGSRNWGYDGVCPFAAQWSYGGVAGLGRLVRASHDHGIAVILDVVYNHLGPEGNYLGDFGPYFTDRSRTPWGSALNFDGPGSDHVREFFIQSSLHWTQECGIDGLRLDAVHAIIDRTARPFLEELTERNHAEAGRRGRRVLIIAESSDNDPRLVRPPGRGGLGLDGCWNDDYHHAIRAAITGERNGYYRPFGEAGQIAKALRDRFVFTGEYSASHDRRHGAPADDIEHSRFVVFTQNHDQVGNRPLGDRLDHIAGLDGARVAAALIVLSPFTPMLWMGEEYAESAPFQYFVSHSDEALIEAVRRGRAEEFAEFQGEAGVPDPQDKATFERSRLSWNGLESGPHASMLEYYTELLKVRRRFDLAARADTVTADASGAVVTLRYRSAPVVLIVANTSIAPAAVDIDDPANTGNRRFTIMLDSDDPRWGGRGLIPPPARPIEHDVTIGPRSVLVLIESSESP